MFVRCSEFICSMQLLSNHSHYLWKINSTTPNINILIRWLFSVCWSSELGMHIVCTNFAITLTHLLPDKTAAISQTIFTGEFFVNEKFCIFVNILAVAYEVKSGRPYCTADCNTTAPCKINLWYTGMDTNIYIYDLQTTTVEIVVVTWYNTHG